MGDDYIAEQMANIKYLDPPEAGRTFVFAPWDLGNGTVIDLITPEYFDYLPKGTELTCINGRTCRKGIDFISDDTREGLMGYGLPGKSADKLTYEGPFRTE